MAGGPGAAGFTAFFAATAIAGYRFKAMPAPVAGMSALAAITQPLAYGVAVTDTGVFAADGFLGGFIPIITFVLAMVPHGPLAWLHLDLPHRIAHLGLPLTTVSAAPAGAAASA